MTHLANCKICGSVAYAPTQAKKNKAWTRCPNRKCPINGVWMTVKQWNALPYRYIRTEDELYDNLENVAVQYAKEAVISKKGNVISIEIFPELDA
jgi:hypothetical protein